MANSTVSLDYAKCTRILQQMQECLESIVSDTSVYVTACEEALKGPTKPKWLQSIVGIGNETMGQAKTVTAIIDDIKDGLRKFDEQLDEFVESDINMDI